MRLLPPVLFALTAHSVLVHARTHRHKRALIDTCANVEADLGLLGLAGANLKLCLCLSTLPTIISTNAQLRAAAALLGTSTVTTALTALINAAGVNPCTFPDHAVPTVPQCDSNCNFTCTDGFTPVPPSNPTACTCEGVVCNGICGTVPCSSQRARRHFDWKYAACPRGWSACGIWGGLRGDYECVDVTRDLWSCGGCGVPLRHNDPPGIDCTAIPGVLDVACLDSRCLVRRCKEGFHVSPDEATCILETGDPVLVHNEEIHYRYGER